MSAYRITEDEPREIVRLDVDEYADMHTPGSPYRLTLWEPETGVLDDDNAHACRNLNRTQLVRLGQAIQALLDETTGSRA